MKRSPMASSLSGVAQVAVNFGIVLLTIPIFVRVLGFQVYSVYALITAVSGVTFLTNFGFNTSLIKYLAEQKERNESNYDILVTAIVVGGAGAVLVAAMLGAGEIILTEVLNLDAGMRTPEVRTFYRLCVCASMFQIMGQIPTAVLDSQQRVYVSNTIQLVVGLLSKSAIVVSLLVVPGLPAIGWILFTASVLGTAALIYFAGVAWGPISCPALRSRFIPVLRKHLTYGRGIYGSAVMGFIYEPMTKVLIGRYVGLVPVGYFDIAFRIKTLLWTIFERFIYPMLPLLAAKKGIKEVSNLIEEVEQKLLVLVVPVLVGTVFCAGPIVRIWLGSDLAPIVVSIIAIVSSYFVALLFVPLYYYLMVKDHPNKTFLLQTMNVVVNLAAFAALVPLFGYYGALAAFCLAVCASSATCGWYQWTLLRSSPIPSSQFIGKIAVLAAALIALNIGVSVLVTGPAARIGMLLVVDGVATAGLYRWLHLFTHEDVDRFIGRGGRLAGVLDRILVQAT